MPSDRHVRGNESIWADEGGQLVAFGRRLTYQASAKAIELGVGDRDEHAVEFRRIQILKLGEVDDGQIQKVRFSEEI